MALVPAVASALFVAPPSGAGTFNANFNDGQVPIGSQVFGNALVESPGGVGDTACLKITKSINSQAGAFIIEDLGTGGHLTVVEVGVERSSPRGQGHEPSRGHRGHECYPSHVFHRSACFVFAIREPPQIRVKTPGVNPSSLAFLPAPSACPCLRAWRPDRILTPRLGPVGRPGARHP